MDKTLDQLINESKALKSKMACYEAEIEYLKELCIQTFGRWSVIEAEIKNSKQVLDKE